MIKVLSWLFLVSLSGCASILGGSNQSIAIKTMSGAEDVNGSQCTLSNDKGTWYATTPASITVHRSRDAIDVKCEHAGYIAGTNKTDSDTRAIVFGNIIFGLGSIIGAAVDIGSGAAYDYPAPIVVPLTPSQAAKANDTLTH